MVRARDLDALRPLLRSHPYPVIAEAAGVTAAYISLLANGQRDSVSLPVAAGIETALDKEPGELFRLDPDEGDLRPYL